MTKPDITLTLRKGLEREGYRVDSYNDPIDALSDFKANVYGLLCWTFKCPKLHRNDSKGITQKPCTLL